MNDDHRSQLDNAASKEEYIRLIALEDVFERSPSFTEEHLELWRENVREYVKKNFGDGFRVFVETLSREEMNMAGAEPDEGIQVEINSHKLTEEETHQLGEEILNDVLEYTASAKWTGGCSTVFAFLMLVTAALILIV